MAIQTLNGGRGLFDAIQWSVAVWTATSHTLLTFATSTTRISFSFIVPKTGTLDLVEFRTGNVTTGDTVRVSFQNQTAAGIPDGTVDQYRDIAIGGSDDNAWLATGLMTDDGTDGGAKRSVTAGDRVSIVFHFPSYVAGDIWLQYLASATEGYSTSIFRSTDSGSSWTFQPGAPAVAVKYSDGTYAFMRNTSPFDTLSTYNVASNSTPDEHGMRFKLPYKIRAAGLAFKAAADLTNMTLYSDAGSIIAGPTVPEPTHNQTSGSLRREAIFTSPVDLDADTWYRATWKPSSTTSRAISYNTIDSDGIRENFNQGLNMSGCYRVDAGAFTDDPTVIFPFTILTSGADDGAGSGSGCALSNGTAVIPPTCA